MYVYIYTYGHNTVFTTRKTLSHDRGTDGGGRQKSSWRTVGGGSSFLGGRDGRTASDLT